MFNDSLPLVGGEGGGENASWVESHEGADEASAGGRGSGLHPLLVIFGFPRCVPLCPRYPCRWAVPCSGLWSWIGNVSEADRVGPQFERKERKSKRGEMPKRVPRKQRVADSAQLDSGGQQAARREAWCAN